jgi:hypothetical protein
VTINQPGQKSGATQINGLYADWSISVYFRRRTDLSDLAVFNQHGCRRKHIPGSWIE